jgi:ABC-type antimicrobial peptide transport system permease subunit
MGADAFMIAKNLIIKYGLLLGITKVIIELLNYAFGDLYVRPPWVGILGFLAFIGFIIWAIKDFKDLNEGYLNLGDAIKTGLGVSLIAGFIGAVFMYILIHYIEPDFIQKSLEAQEQLMLEKNPDMDEATLEMALDMTKKFMTPASILSITLAGTLIGGLLVSLIAGLIMQKKEEI